MTNDLSVDELIFAHEQSRLLIVFYENGNVLIKKEIKDVGITNGQLEYKSFSPGQYPMRGGWEKYFINLSMVKKVVYDRVTIWEAEE